MALSAGLFKISDPMQAPELDARRYTDYALNLFDYGTFGLTGEQRDNKPAPGNANSPLYPAFLSTVMALDPGLAESLRCEMSITDLDPQHAKSPCSQNYNFITVVQLALAGLSIVCVWVTSQLMFARLSVSWLAALLILASTKVDYFAHRLLTENLVLLFFAGLLLGLTLILQQDKKRSWSLVGVTLALLALTRPEYLYLFYACAVMALVVAIYLFRLRYWARVGVLIASAMVILAPWMVRNYVHFDSAALTGGYGDKTIAYRTAYNRMTEQEWQASFIYWLPGYGEVLAAKYLPPSSYRKLGTDPNSYLYKEGTEIFEDGLAAVDGDRKKLTGYLLRTEILEKPIAHFLSSIPLAWRGILTGKYLAIVGLPCFVFLLFFAVQRRHLAIIVLYFPALLMVTLYAAISVSIPRYNIYLIYYYGIATAWFSLSTIDVIKSKFFSEKFAVSSHNRE